MSSVQSNIAERVFATVAESLNVSPDRVFGDAQFTADLGADSLDTVELVMALEEEFGCEIPDNAAEQIRTVNDAVRYVQEHCGATGEVSISPSDTKSNPAS